jgi:hypothetical protein
MSKVIKDVVFRNRFPQQIVETIPQMLIEKILQKINLLEKVEMFPNR